MERGEFAALTAILTAMYRDPELLDNHYVEIFQICCALADGEKYKRAVRSFPGDLTPNGTESSPGLIVLLVTYSLQTIGSTPMRLAIRRNEDAFAPTILRRWKSLFGTMTAVYEENVRNPDAFDSPSTKHMTASFLCNTLTACLMCRDLVTLFKDPTPLFESAWKWWLYGGPPRYEDPNSAVHNLSTSACLSFLAETFPETNLMAIALEVSPSFGGVPAIAKLALSAFHSCATTKDHAEDVSFHFIPFSASLAYEAEKDGKQVADEFINAIYELDGSAKLIEGLTHMATFSRAVMLPRLSDSFVTLVLMILKTIITKNYRQVERAARCGILELFVALDPDRGDFSPSLVNAAKALIDVVPIYFVYHSVIGAYAEAMRKLTEGNEIKDSCLAEGPFTESWRLLKRALIDRYCIKSFFDIVVVPSPRSRPCNSVWRA